MGLPSFIAPNGDVELLSLCRVFLFLNMAGMLTGHSFIAIASSLLAVYTLLQDSSSYESFASSRRLDTTLLDRWFVLSSVAASVSVISWFLMWASTFQKDAGHAYQTFFFGFSLQKLWGVGVACILFEDVRLVVDQINPGKKATKKGKNHGADDENGTIARNRRLFRRQRHSSVLALEWHELRVRIVKGRNLVPMDHAFIFFGKMVTSDPYVEVLLGTNSFGSTPYVRKTLNPVWPEHGSSFRIAVLPKSLEISKGIECRIFDYDSSSKDDAMGTVFVPIPKERNKPVQGWYSVGTGKGDTFCKAASGELYVQVEVVCP
jgi:C2 domain